MKIVQKQTDLRRSTRREPVQLTCAFSAANKKLSWDRPGEPSEAHPISGHGYQSTTTSNSLITVAVVSSNLGFKCGRRSHRRRRRCRRLSFQHLTRLDFDLLSVHFSSTVLLISPDRSSSSRISIPRLHGDGETASYSLIRSS